MDFRIGTKAYIEQNGEVLYLYEDGGDFDDFHTLPGGGVEDGETGQVALKRELREELGVEITIGDYRGLCVYEHRSFDKQTLYFVFECSLNGTPIPNPDEGIKNVNWFAVGQPPVDCLRPIRDFLTTPVSSGLTGHAD